MVPFFLSSLVIRSPHGVIRFKVSITFVDLPSDIIFISLLFYINRKVTTLFCRYARYILHFVYILVFNIMSISKSIHTYPFCVAGQSFQFEFSCSWRLLTEKKTFRLGIAGRY